MANPGLQFPPPFTLLQHGHRPTGCQQSVLGPPPFMSPALRPQRPPCRFVRPAHGHWNRNSPYAQYLRETPPRGQPRASASQGARPQSKSNRQFQPDKRRRWQQKADHGFHKRKRIAGSDSEDLDPFAWKPPLPKLETPEQIEKWRQDRRKNYPTVENVRQKLKRDERRQLTGAVATTCDLLGGKRKKQWNRKSVQQNSRSDPRVVGTGVLHKDSVQASKVTVSTGSDLCSASGLQALAGYGSNSESEDDDKSDLISAKADGESDRTVARHVTGNTEKNQKDAEHQQSPRKLRLSGRRKGNRRSDSGKVTNKPSLTAQPTLLQKLLVEEIRHDRNTLLQCIRYIVRKDFFRTS